MAAGGCCAKQPAPPSAAALPVRSPPSSPGARLDASHAANGGAPKDPVPDETRERGAETLGRAAMRAHGAPRPGEHWPPARASPGNGFHVLNQQSLYSYTYYVALGARTSIVKTSAAKTICSSDTLHLLHLHPCNMQPAPTPTHTTHTHAAHIHTATHTFSTHPALGTLHSAPSALVVHVTCRNVYNHSL